MKIEHIGIYVNELETTKEFFEKYFSVKAGPKYHNKRTGFASYFLSFGDGETRIEIMSRKEVDVNNLLEALGYNHIAISVVSKEAVDEITRKLKKMAMQF